MNLRKAYKISSWQVYKGLEKISLFILSQRKNLDIVGVDNKKVKNNRGFSVIEMLIVIGIVMIIMGITAPVGFRYYQTQLLDESACLVFDTLRRAQQNALFQKNDSRFGVSFEENSFILFEGNTFLTRDENEDEIFILSNNISIGGLQEVVFSKKYGTTTTGGEIVISMGERIKYVDINTKGRVDKR